MATTDRDYYEVLGVAARRGRGDDQEGIPQARPPAASRRLDEPDAELRFREATEAYEVLSSSETRALYDRYGHAGLRSGGFQPTNFDMGGLSDIFSAFFGDDVFGGGAAAAPARRRHRRDDRDRAEPVGDAAPRCRCRSTSTVAVRDLRRRRRRAGNAAAPLRTLRRHRSAAAGDAQRPRPVRAHARLPATAAAAARSSSTRATTCDGGGCDVERRELEVDVPAGHPRRPAHPALRRGPCGRARRARRRRLRARPRQARPTLRARRERHLLAGRPDDRRRPRSARR